MCLFAFTSNHTAMFCFDLNPLANLKRRMHSRQMSQDKFILTIGAEVGGCLVDGLGDGVMVAAPGLEKGMLRSVCFGLLQVNTNTRNERNHDRPDGASAIPSAVFTRGIFYALVCWLQSNHVPV